MGVSRALRAGALAAALALATRAGAAQAEPGAHSPPPSPDAGATDYALDRGPGPLSQLHYGVTAGGMIPVGPQGRGLRRGAHFGAMIYGESNAGVQIGGEGSYTLSRDPHRTRIAHAGLFMRLSPNPEDYRMYVQIGAGGYYIRYPTSPPSLPKLDAVLRPGASFAVGGDIVQFMDLTLGGSVSYHGILVERYHAVAFSGIRLHLTYQHLGY